MKKKIIMTLILLVSILIIFQIKVQAKSYYIENMEINASILDNGDVDIEQTLEYSFNGNYNGIYITIPTGYKNNENVISEIKDEIYDVQGVELKSVKMIDGAEETEYRKVNEAYNGTNEVFTEQSNYDKYQLKVYSPSSNENQQDIKTMKM